MDQFAWQLMPDDVLGHAADLDQRIEINAGIDAHLLAADLGTITAAVVRRA